MDASEFRAYKMRYRTAIEAVLKESESGRLDEAAFPAYTHTNPLINWLFWQRIRIAMNWIERHAPYESVLDFGCGSGVMLPFLAKHGRRVSALDLDLVPLERMQKYVKLPGNVETYDGKEKSAADLTKESFDLIVALDVLEHVPDIGKTAGELLSLLKPGGTLLISGPSENLFYKIGRMLAGPEYSGHYHHRGIAEIKREVAHLAPVKRIATLYRPVALFEIFSATKV